MTSQWTPGVKGLKRMKLLFYLVLMVIAGILQSLTLLRWMHLGIKQILLLLISFGRNPYIFVKMAAPYSTATADLFKNHLQKTQNVVWHQCNFQWRITIFHQVYSQGNSKILLLHVRLLNFLESKVRMKFTQTTFEQTSDASIDLMSF